MEKPLVYLILGAAGSGRRELLADLVDGVRQPGDRPVVMLPADEPENDLDARLPGAVRWQWADGRIEAELPSDPTHVYVLTDGRRDPVDQVEAVQSWLATAGWPLARVLCVVNCQLAEKHHPSLLGWYEACIHFADVVLLNRRQGVANKWMSDFVGHFEKQFYPCLFEMVKDGRIRNPALILTPEARRMSHVFDDDETPAWAVAEGIDDDTIIEEEEDDEESGEDGEDAVEPETDIYFERDAAGRRKRRIPDINRFLGGGTA